MPVVSLLKRGIYQDSVRLMRLSEHLSGLEQVNQAFAAMGTAANKRVLAEAGLLTEPVRGAGANDLVVVVDAVSEDAAKRALADAERLLAGTDRPSVANGVARAAPRTLEQARRHLPDANLMFISTPGPYAALDAAKALGAGMHVFLFSDNVTLEHERALKHLAVSRGLLMMGPGCGTAVINGVALAFANVLKRGPVGVVGAAGTGLQELTSLVDRGGVGISQAIGVGGRDLSEAIGGCMMLQAIALLAADPQTEQLVLVSKPPAAAVAARILEVARATGKPVVATFLGSDRVGTENGVVFAPTIEAAAEAVVRRATGEERSPYALDPGEFARLVDGERSAGDRRPATCPPGTRAANAARSGATGDRRRDPLPPTASATGAARPRATHVSGRLPPKGQPGRRYLRGLFSGGSLCDEAMYVLQGQLGDIYSNVPLSPALALPDAWRSKAHTCIDLGEEEFTRGRPHPMIDMRLRQERLLAEADDPEVAVILLDVVIGYGAHADPAGALATTIRAARAKAAAAGRYLAVVAHVCGTVQDPQGLEQQERTLREAGVVVLPTNAQAARVAAAIVR